MKGNENLVDAKFWRGRFERAVKVPEADVKLAEAALLIATDEYPDLAIDKYLSQFEAMAVHVSRHLPSARRARSSIEILNRFLFKELRFVGNRADYYDPRNSYLNDVLDRKTGLPITLSIIYLELAHRLGLPIFGVGLPGHFIVEWKDEEGRFMIDPFNRGEFVDRPRLEDLVRETFQGELRLDPDWLKTVDSKYILTRILNNLKVIFLHTGNDERAWAVVDKLLILDPDSIENIRDMGLISMRVGAYRQAAICLERYLLSESHGPDFERVRLYLRVAQNQVARLN